MDNSTPPLHAEQQFRRALGAYATGVTVVTIMDAGGRRWGVTINSFSSLSLRPPMVLWSLSSASSRAGLFEVCRGYAINVLSEDQEALSKRFAAELHLDQFEGVRLRDGMHGAPLIDGCGTWIEVDNTHRHRHGDHILFIGHVRNLRSDATAAPLVFHGGRYRRLSPD